MSIAPSTIAGYNNSNAAQLNRAALIGIIAGGSAFLIVVFLLALVFLLRRSKRRRQQSSPEEAFSEDEQAPPKRPTHSRGPSYEQTQQRRSVGDGPVYQAVSFEPQDTRLLQTPVLYHDKDPSSEATTPNMRNSVTLESEPLTAPEEEIKTAPLDSEAKDSIPLDPFSAGYIPPPSPTPSEYVIVEHSEQPPPMQTSRDKRESRTSISDFIVPEEGREFSTLGSVASGGQFVRGHQRTLSNEASGSSSGTNKRISNRLQKPRRSVESTNSLFLRSTSPSQLQRSMSPIKFPRDPFDASLEEEPVAALRPSFDRSSLDRHNRSSASYEMHVSSRPSMDTIGAGGTGPRKKTHMRSPSSPTRVIPNSSSFLGLRKHGASASALSLQQYQPEPSAPYMNMNSPNMADASVYDFDIYHQPPPSTSHPPPSAASAVAALSGSDRYGSTGSKKRFSASMSDLPTTAGLGRSRLSASMSTNQVNSHGKEGTEDRNGLEPTTNLYIPKESLDLPQ